MSLVNKPKWDYNKIIEWCKGFKDPNLKRKRILQTSIGLGSLWLVMYLSNLILYKVLFIEFFMFTQNTIAQFPIYILTSLLGVFYLMGLPPEDYKFSSKLWTRFLFGIATSVLFAIGLKTVWPMLDVTNFTYDTFTFFSVLLLLGWFSFTTISATSNIFIFPYCFYFLGFFLNSVLLINMGYTYVLVLVAFNIFGWFIGENFSNEVLKEKKEV